MQPVPEATACFANKTKTCSLMQSLCFCTGVVLHQAPKLAPRLLYSSSVRFGVIFGDFSLSMFVSADDSISLCLESQDIPRAENPQEIFPLAFRFKDSSCRISQLRKSAQKSCTCFLYHLISSYYSLGYSRIEDITTTALQSQRISGFRLLVELCH